MAKAIKYTYDGEEYILEFTRESVRTIENAGFNVQDYRAKPLTTGEVLFQGAFLAKHRKIKPAVMEQMWKNTENKEDLLSTLIEMYADTVDSFMDEPSEANTKKATWEKTF